MTLVDLRTSWLSLLGDLWVGLLSGSMLDGIVVGSLGGALGLGFVSYFYGSLNCGNLLEILDGVVSARTLVSSSDASLGYSSLENESLMTECCLGKFWNGWVWEHWTRSGRICWADSSDSSLERLPG